MSLIQKLKYKLAGRYVMKSFGRWVPLIAATAYVAAAVLRGLGKLTQAEAIESAVRGLGLPTTITPEELGIAAGIGAGLFLKFKALIQSALDPMAGLKAPVLKTEKEHEAFNQELDKLRAEGKPFDLARREALETILTERKFKS